MSYIGVGTLEAIARNVIKKYNPSLILGEPQEIPIEDIIESMGLTLEYQSIRNNGRILGETVFDDGAVAIYDRQKKEYTLLFMKRGTILLDESLLNSKSDGRLRFTAAHELAHWLIHQEIYMGSVEVAAKMNHSSSNSDKQTETQADILASYLLMPKNQLKKAFYKTNGDKVVELSKLFGVSKQAMKIRLSQHNLI